MAQLRQDHEEFVQQDTVVIAVGPDTKQAFRNYWQENDIPFIGLADLNHEVASQYDQEVNLLKLGRMPAQMIVDKTGVLHFVHYANTMSDIAENEDILKILNEIES